MIFRFKFKDEFILNFWRALQYVASLKEDEDINKKKKLMSRKSTIFAGVQYKNENMTEDEKNHAFLRYDFCSDLLLNKVVLKTKALDFTILMIKILHVMEKKNKGHFLFLFHRMKKNISQEN